MSKAPARDHPQASSAGPRDARGDAQHYAVQRIAAAAGLPVERIELVRSIASTNTELLERAFGGMASPPRALVAVEQTAGRGRRGRSWAARPGCSMTLSVSIERAVGAPRTGGADSRPYQALPLALGVTVADVLAADGCALQLKWPNDLLRAARKVGGLLVEAKRGEAIERTVIGVGLNLLPDAERDAAIDQPVAALFDAHSVPPPDRSDLAGRLIGAIVRACALNAADGFAPFLASWRARDVLAGQPVRILEAGGAHRDGVAVGIDEDGALRVRTAHGEQRVLAGDVSVRAV